MHHTCSGMRCEKYELKGQTNEHSEEFISELRAEIESARETCLCYRAQLAAADRAYVIVMEARILVEKDLQSQNVRHVEEVNRPNTRSSRRGRQ
jgi:hypothetical protein